MLIWVVEYRWRIFETYPLQSTLCSIKPASYPSYFHAVPNQIWFLLPFVASMHHQNKLIIEVSTGPKFPARPAKLFFRPGPARNQCIIKFSLYNCFEILQENQYNYIKLHSYFPLVQLLYCPSTTIMYNVQLYQ